MINLPSKKHLRNAYLSQKHTSAKRGIEFNLTWQEWITWWIDTGHIRERGKGKGKYVMARPGDKGPYSLKNIKCITQEQNATEAHLGKATSDSTKQLMSEASLGKPKSTLHRENIKKSKQHLSKQTIDRMTTAANNRKPKYKYITPLGVFYKSKDAAQAHKLTITGVQYKVKKQHKGWSRINNE